MHIQSWKVVKCHIAECPYSYISYVLRQYYKYKNKFFQSGGLDCYNPASLGSIPLYSLPHVLQEQMNGALANGSGYQSDSSATQSPPQAL